MGKRAFLGFGNTGRGPDHDLVEVLLADHRDDGHDAGRARRSELRDVYLDSPAHEAGLTSYSDFILGTREICFTSLDHFAKYILINEGRELLFFVYSKETE